MAIRTFPHTLTVYDRDNDPPASYHPFSEWERVWHRTESVCETGDTLLAVDAATDSMGGVAIYLSVLRADGRVHRFSPYYNQYATHDEGDGACEYDDCADDPREWLSTMAGATDWYNNPESWHHCGSEPHGMYERRMGGGE